MLERIKRSGDIFFAEADRPWVLNGAAVRVSMVGFDDGSEVRRELDAQPVEGINANLTGVLDLTKAQRLRENEKISFMGDTKGGPFDISAEIAYRMLPLSNPHGKANSDVVRPWANGDDLTGKPRGMWIIDFPPGMAEGQAALYEAPFEYVRAFVRPIRVKNRRKAYAERWWMHVEPRPAMRAALGPVGRFICTPAIAKHRLFAWQTAPTLPDHALFVFARDDDYFFGVLHSRAHELWALALGTQLESRPRYTPTTCFETFPFPWPPGKEPLGSPEVEAIAEAARELNQLRESWLDPDGMPDDELKKRTLTNLYNERPTWLDVAHRKLDEAVFAAYGWPVDMADQEVLSRLLALNLERAG